MKDILKLYQYSEKLKSELIIGMKLVRILENLKDKEFEGGLRVVSEFFSALNVEVGIAYNSTNDERFRRVYEILSSVDFVDVDSAMETLGRAMTLITNCAADAYEGLQKEGLL